MQLNNYTSIKASHISYQEDGQGRDRYISMNNGGLTKSFPRYNPDFYVSTQKYNPISFKLSPSMSQQSQISERQKYYINDGTGRDTYIGNYMNNSHPERFQKNNNSPNIFVKNLRMYDFVPNMQESHIQYKQNYFQIQAKNQQTHLISRLSVPKILKSGSDNGFIKHEDLLQSMQQSNLQQNNSQNKLPLLNRIRNLSQNNSQVYLLHKLKVDIHRKKIFSIQHK